MHGGGKRPRDLCVTLDYDIAYAWLYKLNCLVSQIFPPTHAVYFLPHCFCCPMASVTAMRTGQNVQFQLRCVIRNPFTLAYYGDPVFVFNRSRWWDMFLLLHSTVCQYWHKQRVGRGYYVMVDYLNLPHTDFLCSIPFGPPKNICDYFSSSCEKFNVKLELAQEYLPSVYLRQHTTWWLRLWCCQGKYEQKFLG